MKPLIGTLLLGVFAIAVAVGCVPSTAQTPYGTSRTIGTNQFGGGTRTWGTARGPVAPATPFRGAPFKELALPARSVAKIAYSADGKKVAVAGGAIVQVWATESGKPLAKIDLTRETNTVQLAFTADGNSVMTHTDFEKVVRSWDAQTGEKGKEWTFEDTRGHVLALSPTGDRLLLRGLAGEKGHAVLDAGKKEPIAKLTPWDAGLNAAFAPDGAGIATRSGAGTIKLVNVQTDKTVWEINAGWSPSGRPNFGFTGGGKYLVSSIGQGRPQLAVFGAADGKKWCDLPVDGWSSVLSNDGRVMVTITNGVLRMFDLAAEQEVPGFATPNGTCVALAASPDGKQIAAAGYSADARGLVLYLTAFPTLPPAVVAKTDLDRSDEEEYWTALTSANLFRRKLAEDVFLARPEQTMALVSRRLVPVLDIERLRAEDLVENLADPDPEFRKRVAAELERYAVPFEPLLRTAHEKATGDAKTKLGAVLQKGTEPSAKLAADFRGIEVLEKLGTPAAKEYLAKLAAGAKGARLTEAAAAALRRLQSKS